MGVGWWGGGEVNLFSLKTLLLVFFSVYSIDNLGYH